MGEIEELRRADMQLIRALRDTQLEQGRTLQQHSELLGALVAGQVEHGKILAEHSKMLGEHGKMLRTLAAGQATILEHLGLMLPASEE
ncbi:hypothetical protein ABT173_30805 [Streptomyces sp. NPDC001795]|uniref:hypothetical protein n=1 Tax=unclassified Streptomyces TaxID=2593676 RepID=UPI00332CEE8A